MKIDLAEEYSSKYVKISKARWPLNEQWHTLHHPDLKVKSEILQPDDLA